jgi:hypothetical protein
MSFGKTQEFKRLNQTHRIHILLLSLLLSYGRLSQDLGALLRRLCSSFSTSAKASSSPERCS